MRQIRIESAQCDRQIFRSECTFDYHFFNKDRSNYEPGWTNKSVKEYSSTIRRSFEYQSNSDVSISIGSHGTYDGGGYVYEFRGRLVDIRSNLSMLHELAWIDHRTRANIIEMTLYNPNVRLYTSVILMTEFLSNGGVYPQIRIEPLYFDGRNSSLFQFLFNCLM